MRLFGWYPDGHRSTLWVAHDADIGIYQRDIGTLDRLFIEQFEGHPSVEITLPSAVNVNIKKFTSYDFYRLSERGRGNSTTVETTDAIGIENNRSKYPNLVELGTTICPISHVLGVDENIDNLLDHTLGYLLKRSIHQKRAENSTQINQECRAP